jgi:hypothetical protein
MRRSADNHLCRAVETTTGRFTRTVVLETELLRCTVLADKGADIYT